MACDDHPGIRLYITWFLRISFDFYNVKTTSSQNYVRLYTYGNLVDTYIYREP